ncbi:hypothetical protein XELAEV_18047296mg [Xenopus laevis]|uniref:Secreted protein n=1 Tax=Xenopus laevis TaxID=8355 RepID=A0A974BVB3_XENLA|nr:hypothetical protein XELAEV_18047296mg [Xenopus laevis]
MLVRTAFAMLFIWTQFNSPLKSLFMLCQIAVRSDETKVLPFSLANMDFINSESPTQVSIWFMKSEPVWFEVTISVISLKSLSVSSCMAMLRISVILWE